MNDKVKIFAKQLLHKGGETLSEWERQLLAKFAKTHHVSQDIESNYADQMSLGDKIADKVAQFGGSWKFIGLFAFFLLAWVVINGALLLSNAPDPYPYIFLNLMLSMLAAVQAPVIMMSQNRQSAKDRLAAANDYKVNLKAELEILGVHQKLDEIRSGQMTELIKSQNEQIAILTKLLDQQQIPRS